MDQTAEAIRRVKLSIDRQLSGEIENVFGDPCKLALDHGTIKDEAGVERWVPLVITANGKFAITEDGCAYPVNIGVH